MSLELKNEETLEQRQEGPGVLVVDDEAVIRDLCTRALKAFTVFDAANGEEALSILEKEEIDIVLTDIMMPHTNGLDLLQEIKRREPNKAVVVMTGYADKDIILKALKADADDFITKPINLLQLRTVIDKVLEKQALKEELVQLKKMDRLKTDFLGLVSHKLKTPVTALSLFIQNLSRGVGDPDDPNFQKHLRMMQDESSYLVYLIQDLLYYSEVILQEGPLKLADSDLRSVATAAILEFQPDAANKGLKLINELPETCPPTRFDRKRVRFIVQALLENAIKFTPTGGEITVFGESDESSCRLAIRDTGPGIEENEQKKIFEKFYQIDPLQTGQVRGFGLGLFYARQFARAHGGKIKLESVPGEGTTAWLILPR
ncbi:MAG: hybrid sensor histidine kinase/response regulator [Desulfuromonas sp.]|nr:MAG: hybrid sensor histidine kinase/response regulator [Desulfuromonas sp.]